MANFTLNYKFRVYKSLRKFGQLVKKKTFNNLVRKHIYKLGADCFEGFRVGRVRVWLHVVSPWSTTVMTFAATQVHTHVHNWYSTLIVTQWNVSCERPFI